MSDILKKLILLALIIAVAVFINAVADYLAFEAHKLLGIPYYPGR